MDNKRYQAILAKDGGISLDVPKHRRYLPQYQAEEEDRKNQFLTDKDKILIEEEK
jgi:hypothetical protein